MKYSAFLFTIFLFSTISYSQDRNESELRKQLKENRQAWDLKKLELNTIKDKAFSKWYSFSANSSSEDASYLNSKINKLQAIIDYALSFKSSQDQTCKEWNRIDEEGDKIKNKLFGDKMYSNDYCTNYYETLDVLNSKLTDLKNQKNRLVSDNSNSDSTSNSFSNNTISSNANDEETNNIASNNSNTSSNRSNQSSNNYRSQKQRKADRINQETQQNVDKVKQASENASKNFDEIFGGLSQDLSAGRVENERKKSAKYEAINREKERKIKDENALKSLIDKWHLEHWEVFLPFLLEEEEGKVNSSDSNFKSLLNVESFKNYFSKIHKLMYPYYPFKNNKERMIIEFPKSNFVYYFDKNKNLVKKEKIPNSRLSRAYIDYNNDNKFDNSEIQYLTGFEHLKNFYTIDKFGDFSATKNFYTFNISNGGFFKFSKEVIPNIQKITGDRTIGYGFGLLNNQGGVEFISEAIFDSEDITIRNKSIIINSDKSQFFIQTKEGAETLYKQESFDEFYANSLKKLIDKKIETLDMIITRAEQGIAEENINPESTLPKFVLTLKKLKNSLIEQKKSIDK